ncbi:glycosyl hydrolase family 43 [Fusarium phyllophilum]|uniref:Glycosyl hydrolase family 43 n=1 Tax=Fusarium phyllophilum TaxID=47803 RepID=A0A8H5IQ18_9HYPO|nr:glycosyl hydrolase family 43 [Fusarium phyllophilum]
MMTFSLFLAAAAVFHLPVAAETFNQPPIFLDLPDIDLIRVDDTYYYSASTFHYSPGAPILRSYDFLPSFDFNDHKSQLDKRKGVQWRSKNGKTYVYTAPKIEGPWTKASSISNYCLHDAGLLIDDHDSIYVSSGQWTPNGADSQTWISKLDKNLQVEKQDGDVWGPYDSWHRVLKNNGKPIEGSGSPHQGALVETPEGDYWYMAYVELGTSGRFPVLAPLKWDEGGWPNVDLDSNGHWKSSYDYPLPRHNVEPVEGTFEFKESKLPPRFEWNHDPNNGKWTTGPDGLVLHTATITDDFFSAQNTLTHRILGPQSNATIELDYSSMVDGDRAGLVSLRYDAGWIAIAKDGSSTTLQMVDKAAIDPDNSFVTTSKGNVIASKSISGGKIWLRCQISTVSRNRSTFLYSTDGKTFVKLGQEHVTKQGGVWFTGTRHGIFNFATKKSGGHVIVKKFDIRLS